jgi:hypothetical protein
MPPYHFISRARICKLLRSPGIDSKERIPPPREHGWPGVDNPIPTQFLAPIECLKIPTQDSIPSLADSIPKL